MASLCAWAWNFLIIDAAGILTLLLVKWHHGAQPIHGAALDSLERSTGTTREWSVFACFWSRLLIQLQEAWEVRRLLRPGGVIQGQVMRQEIWVSKMAEVRKLLLHRSYRVLSWEEATDS